MSATAQGNPEVESYFSLADVWQLAREYKYSIMAITVVGALVAAVIAWSITPIFRAEVVVSEVKDKSLGSGGITSDLKGLASLAGVSMGGFTDSSGEKRAILQSRALVQEFIRRKQLLPILLEDTRDHRTMWFAVKRFQRDVLTIREDTQTGVLTISIEWRDPQLAARWANDFVSLANEIVRGRDARVAERNLEFLNRQLEKTTVLEMRRILYALIESETKTLMLANSREEYAFAVVDPAVPPELKAKPARSLIVLLGVACGLALGGLFALIRRGRREMLR